MDSVCRLATGGSDGSVRLWDLQYQACVLNLRGCDGVISVVKFNPEESIVFAAGDNTKIISWDLQTGKVSKTYTGHFSKVTSIAFHHDREHMLSTSRDKVIILWNIEKGVAVRTVPVFESLESIVAFPKKFKICGVKHSDGVFVATAGEKGVIKVWNMSNSKLVYEQKNSLVSQAKEEGGLAIINLLYNTNLKQFAVITVDHNIIIHDLKTFECLKQFVGFSDEILDVCFLGENDSHLAVATNSADIKLYENDSMNCQLLRGHMDIVLALARTNADLNLLLSSGKDNSVRLWKLTDKNIVICVGVGSKHTGSVGSIALTQTGLNFAVSVSQDTCIKMWEIPTKFNDENRILECTKTEIAHQKDINCVTISPNDKIIATGSQDKVAKLWSENLELIGSLRGHKRGIWCIRFSPIDQVIVTSSADCTVKLWSVTDLSCLKTLQGHDSSVLKIEFLCNGLQILTAGADGFLKLFNVKSSECATTLDQHTGRIWALTVNSDESKIVSGGSDSLLIKWKDVTVEKRLEKIKEMELLTEQEQRLSNLVQNNELLKALKLSLKLERPFQTLKIIRGIIKKGDAGLTEAVGELSEDQKDSLMKCATSWNTNSKNCQPAQLILNILMKEMQAGTFKPAGLSSTLEATLPYTDRHFRRMTQLLQDLYIINYTVNCMQPHAKKL